MKRPTRYVVSVAHLTGAGERARFTEWADCAGDAMDKAAGRFRLAYHLSERDPVAARIVTTTGGAS